MTELSINWTNSTKCIVESNHHSKYPGQNTECIIIMAIYNKRKSVRSHLQLGCDDSII